MAPEPAVRVVVQHGNRLLRELLAENLAHVPGVCVVGTVPSRTRLAEVCEGRVPDVAVFEADAWDAGPLPAPVRLVGLCADGPGTRLAGTTAVVPYGSGLRVLLDVIKQTPRRPPLTTRERQVLCLISAGHSPRQVAAVLGISPRTVENHKQQIFAKLDVHSQAHAVAHAVRLGLVGVPAELPGPLPVSLTPREREILAAIGSGHTTRQTASELGISARTVENLQGTLFRKLRVHSRTAALVAAHDLRLIEV
ncbi:LuxR C-terminal-related transcriptional regulator [Amycolatopsis sp. OK19-0408]|uniref:LuxR C-terminal-related transcriptional regulator n=1 Tax=Amycolatopsis iheyensis TaxID=2945988 RepID=A0A9X2NEG3_9PSEU|nr:LuxR C-terminal-related transcriptional regulator [Amycolatopsis iheyensis]MCR6485390.1 LuxR C-terminal-related transcriptional regulator [Amycolatopsis iheyensis]